MAKQIIDHPGVAEIGGKFWILRTYGKYFGKLGRLNLDGFGFARLGDLRKEGRVGNGEFRTGVRKRQDEKGKIVVVGLSPVLGVGGIGFVVKIERGDLVVLIRTVQYVAGILIRALPKRVDEGELVRQFVVPLVNKRQAQMLR